MLASARIRERLIVEGQVQAQMRHPNVLAVTDVLDVNGAPGLLMEFVDGPSLDAFIERTPPDQAQALHLFRGVLAGVAEAHAAGLVHRDLKPANVLVATTLRGLVPKVADFGLAKLLMEEEGPAPTARARVPPWARPLTWPPSRSAARGTWTTAPTSSPSAASCTS